MTTEEKYKADGNSDELSKKFHDRAWGIATDLSKQLLNLSTGIIAALFILAFDKKPEFRIVDKTLLLITIFLFGITMLYIILGMKWDASKNYFLGHINDFTKQTEDKRNKNEEKKRYFDKKQREAKNNAHSLFLIGILSAFIFLSIFLFIR